MFSDDVFSFKRSSMSLNTVAICPSVFICFHTLDVSSNLSNDASKLSVPIMVCALEGTALKKSIFFLLSFSSVVIENHIKMANAKSITGNTNFFTLTNF